ncbi:MAG: N-acetyltransferase, partial [Muribaculaceae bacterium]|nr:N-acetyltransferase [Muribaculaceae bacterium]
MIEVKQIEPSKSNLRKFIDFSINLYKDNNCYVPPLVIDEIATLNPKTNPAFDFCEGAYFMALADGKPAGRIAAIINKQINERFDEKIARFGFFDTIDNQEVADALLRAAEEWARGKGMRKIVGPLGFTDLDREGLLIEGFDELSTMATNYNYPYYAPLVENAGYRKDSDWLEFQMTVPDSIPDKINRIAEIV